MRYRKKPVTIDAIIFTYPPTKELLRFCGHVMKNLRKHRHVGAIGEVAITTLEDGSKWQVEHIATEGDYIIKGVKGEFYPCKPDIFELTYEKVENGTV